MILISKRRSLRSTTSSMVSAICIGSSFFLLPDKPRPHTSAVTAASGTRFGRGIKDHSYEVIFMGTLRDAAVHRLLCASAARG